MDSPGQELEMPQQWVGALRDHKKGFGTSSSYQGKDHAYQEKKQRGIERKGTGS